MTSSLGLPCCCIHASYTYKDVAKLVVIKLNSPLQNPIIEAKFSSNSYRSGSYSLMLAKAQVAGEHLIPLSQAQGTGRVLMSCCCTFSRKLWWRQLPCWHQHHIDSRPLGPTESKKQQQQCKHLCFQRAFYCLHASWISDSAQQCHQGCHMSLLIHWFNNTSHLVWISLYEGLHVFMIIKNAIK